MEAERLNLGGDLRTVDAEKEMVGEERRDCIHHISQYLPNCILIL